MRIWTTVALGTLVLGALAMPKAMAAEFDCDDDAVTAGTCPEIVIDGDPESGDALTGFADPSIRQVPGTNYYVMAYSYLKVDADGTNIIESHLAKNLNGGDVDDWEDADTAFWESEYIPDPPAPYDNWNGTSDGHKVIETPNILPVGTGSAQRWYGARMIRYHADQVVGGGIHPATSWAIEISKAATLAALGSTATATQLLVGYAAEYPGLGYVWWDFDTGNGDLDLSTIDGLENCALWFEPALYYGRTSLFDSDERLYLALRCMAFDGSAFDPDESFFHVFRTQKNVNSDAVAATAEDFEWDYVGQLTVQEDIDDLNTVFDLDATGLTQLEIAEAPDGQLMAILTPDIFTTDFADTFHYGCWAIELKPLYNPGLKRSGGNPIVRDNVVTSDLDEHGPGSCGYASGSDTGIIIARRYFGAGLSSYLHATSVDP